jgi:superfamily II DNA/RNA helicase
MIMLGKRADRFVLQHEGMDQKQREVLMKDFLTSASRTLITTDLLARRIDVQQVPLVINIDLLTDKENYIRRIDYGGRSGRKVVAITFVTTDDIRILRETERECGLYALAVEEGVNHAGVSCRILRHADQ